MCMYLQNASIYISCLGFGAPQWPLDLTELDYLRACLLEVAHRRVSFGLGPTLLGAQLNSAPGCTAI